MGGVLLREYEREFRVVFIRQTASRETKENGGFGNLSVGVADGGGVRVTSFVSLAACAWAKR